MPDPIERLNAALRDRYIIENELGTGGMATVYLAEDLKHGRKVAVKVLHPELTAAVGMDRFTREIQIAAQLSHPHVLPLFDSGQADGLLFYVMPFVDGEPLSERLRREVQLPIDEAIRITRGIASGLDYAHSQGIVHRDIKPGNILLHGGEPVLADFGIALVFTAADERITETGFSLGTPAYMSPEQASGDPRLDARSDIYSLACVLYEMLAGQPPFAGPNVQAIMARHVTDPVPPLRTVRPTVGRRLAAAITRALAKVPVDRFATAGAFADSLVVDGVDDEFTVEKSIVVLPFRNLSADAESEYFSDGLTEEIIIDLSKIHSLRVISRTSTMQFKGTEKDVGTICRELNVRYVLDGSVRRSEQSVRITAQLIDGADESPLWADKYTGAFDEVLDMQERVSTAIVEALKLTLTPDERAAMAERAIPNPRAYESYLKGRHQMWRSTEESVLHALQYLQEALEIVGENVLLYAGIAEAYFLFPRIGGKEPEACLQRVEECVNRMFELEPDSSYGHCFFGLLRWKQPGGAVEGFRHLKRAFDRNAADPSIALWLGTCAAVAGRLAIAERSIGRLLETDPLAPMSHWGRGWLDLMRGKPDRALTAFHKARELSPENPQLRLYHALALEWNQRRDEAIALLETKPKEKSDNFWLWISTVYRHALAGEHKRAIRAVSEQLKATARWDETYSWHVARCYASVEQHDEAVAWLENAVSRGFVNYPFLVEHDPTLRPLATHSGFQALMATVKSEWEALEA